jgi:hypothetical protein
MTKKNLMSFFAHFFFITFGIMKRVAEITGRVTTTNS